MSETTPDTEHTADNGTDTPGEDRPEGAPTPGDKVHTTRGATFAEAADAATPANPDQPSKGYTLAEVTRPGYLTPDAAHRARSAHGEDAVAEDGTLTGKTVEAQTAPGESAPNVPDVADHQEG